MIPERLEPEQDNQEVQQWTNPLQTPDGKLTAWGLTARFIERVKSDRFSGYSAFKNPVSSIAETPIGQEIWREVYSEAVAEGKIIPAKPDPVKEFINRTSSDSKVQ